MNMLTSAAQSVLYAFTTCVDARSSRRLRAESIETEAPFLEMKEKSTKSNFDAPSTLVLSTPVEKYVRMVQAGITMDKVKLKMSMEGVDPQLLDYAAQAAPNKSLYDPHQSQQHLPVMSV
ncbi:hypothetical protein H310_12910 [Aphanomyces invadans]|uniref:Uncharacterized protein n=1 Tax=Aphanomyces invadans TaxID=157072 RepID=A0A024THS2_9STRA|nr:hypothetical protein H310_12910 [Aphanomyces invadans]ETV92877.1 hypothetical protein H310_12910 [Aphanomyces invadans]RHY34954.1 hypothetical protein DYB32_000518 [Aphanomyces invadans]|eukprot:XP_008878398.1 hypothetical protein H310_12910 [Aphanomyces invadans]